MEKTKVPPRRVYADDLVVRVGDEEYRPHAGEWVEFRRGVSVRQRMLNRQLVQESTNEEELYPQVMENLAARIVDWNWTDDDGVALPLAVETLEILTFEELNWLLEMSYGGRDDRDRKNGSAPSTGHSPVSGARSRRKNG